MPTLGLASFFLAAVCGAFLFGQAHPPHEEPAAKIFGLTVVEIGVLLGALGTFLEAMRQRHGRLLEAGKRLTGEEKAQAVREAFAETLEAHPEIREHGRRLVTHKATKMGVDLATLRALLESRDEDDAALPDVDPEAETKLDTPALKLPAVDPEKAKEK